MQILKSIKAEVLKSMGLTPYSLFFAVNFTNSDIDLKLTLYVILILNLTRQKVYVVKN